MSVTVYQRSSQSQGRLQINQGHRRTGRPVRGIAQDHQPIVGDRGHPAAHERALSLMQTSLGHAVAASRGWASARQSGGSPSSSWALLGPRMARRCHAQPSRGKAAGPNCEAVCSWRPSRAGAKSTSWHSAARSLVTSFLSSGCMSEGAV